MRSAHCLVTGASGFVGRALVARLLGRGHRVTGLSRTDRSPHPSQAPLATDQSLVRVAVDLGATAPPAAVFDGVDTVFHLAARTHQVTDGSAAETEYWRLNVDGTRRLIDRLRGRGVRRVVFASSVKAVGERGVRIDESTTPGPLTPYGRSKLAAEQLLAEAGRRDGFETVTLRFPLIYGPGQQGNLTRMIDAIAAGRFPPPPSNGNRRSLVHLENAVDALLLAAERPLASAAVYFVTDARPYATREIYDAIRRALGLAPIRWSLPEAAFRMLALAGDCAGRLAGRRVGFDTDAFEKLLGSAEFSCARIQRDLGYQPTRDLPTALPEIVAAHAGAGAHRSGAPA